MSETSDRQLSLFSGLGRRRDESGRRSPPADRAARDFATDPRHNVVLEASAGTGKTSVLVERYLNLLRADVEPSNILAMTFTRQAAAEMRGRIITQLRADAAQSSPARTRWNSLRDRLGEISISTVDAFCLALLREFPLEADLDPGFSLADETEVPRLIHDAVERALVVGARVARDDSGVAALLARLGHWRAHTALTGMLERRLVVPTVLHRFLTAAPRQLTVDSVCGDACRRLADRMAAERRHLDLMMAAGPGDDAAFALVVRDLQHLAAVSDLDPGAGRGSLDRIREFFLTQRGTPRHEFRSGASLPARAKRTYREAGAALAPHVQEVVQRLDRDVNVVMVRAVQRLFGIAVSEYQRDLEARARLDFSDVLQRAIELLRQMDEFARSRYRLEARYQHVLVDEFQDTSRAQWELVSLLVQAWGEGSGLVDEAPVPPTIFIVGDRKQSIYRFRDADGSVLHSAAREIASLRPGDEVRRSITHSFRAVPGLLSFVNDLFTAVAAAAERPDGFTYESHDRFPLQVAEVGSAATLGAPTDGEVVATRPLGVAVADDVETCGSMVASEIECLLREGRVRSTDGSGERTIRPGDIAILFRARQSHREFDRALEQRCVPTYVYKGLGFFDADEIKDVRALVRFLANPASELRAAALLRSRFARLSDPTLVALAGRLSESLIADTIPEEADRLPPDDADHLRLLRHGLHVWLDLVDRLPPAEVIDQVLLDAAYARELHGPHVAQARENLKKIRALIRKLQNRGYATMARIAEQIDHLSGDIATAIVEAFDAVHLMTVHAAKGLEFPVVFLVDLGRGTGAHTPAVRVVTGQADERPSVTVWPYRSEADEAERWRETEETKRLLYVASTRARDRLYLSTVLSDGTAAFNRGSFGEVLPDGFTSMFEAAADRQADVVQWRGPGGRVHELRALSSVVVEPPRAPMGADADRDQRLTVGIDLTPVAERGSVTRHAVTMSVGLHADSDSDGAGTDSATREEAADRRLCGQVVHQLLQRFLGRTVPDSVIAAYATQRLRPELPLQAETIEQLAHRAVRVYHRLREEPDVVALRDRELLFEVPFSFHDPSSPPTSGVAEISTGTIDCLAKGPDNRFTVVEFKTGTARPEHRRQLESYIVAARTMFPTAHVDGRIVYASVGTNRT